MMTQCLFCFDFLLVYCLHNSFSLNKGVLRIFVIGTLLLFPYFISLYLRIHRLGCRLTSECTVEKDCNKFRLSQYFMLVEFSIKLPNPFRSNEEQVAISF
jgi:hypothetical protein